MDQSAYMAKIKNRKTDPNRAMNKYDALSQTEQTLFRQLVGRINWAVQGSRPDLAFEMIDLSTRLKQSTVGDLVRAIKNVERLKTGPSVIKFFNLGPCENWKLVLYTDAALGNLECSGSVGARVCFLTNPDGKVCPLSWNVSKIKSCQVNFVC